MTDLQFYTLMAIPVFGILTNSVVAMVQSPRLISLEARVTNLEDRLETRLLSLEDTFTARFDLLMDGCSIWSGTFTRDRRAEGGTNQSARAIVLLAVRVSGQISNCCP